VRTYTTTNPITVNGHCYRAGAVLRVYTEQEDAALGDLRRHLKPRPFAGWPQTVEATPEAPVSTPTPSPAPAEAEQQPARVVRRTAAVTDGVPAKDTVAERVNRDKPSPRGE
jgi:hypothetical protein